MTVAGNGRGAVVGWCLYDWAMSAFNTVIGTFVFAIYFQKGIVGDPVQGPALWGWAIAASGVLVLILSPVLGAIADYGGRRKRWLGVFTIASIIPTALLWFAVPSPDVIVTAMILVVLATTAFELTYVFYNALLLDVAPPDRLGRISGLGWGVGYAGGVVALTLALFGLVGAGEAPPLLPLPTGNAENVRATVLLVAGWWAVFAIPLFVLVRERPGGLPLRAAVRAGLSGLRSSIARVAARPGALRFLVASMVYREGFNILFAMGGAYAAVTYGLELSDVILFGIGLNVTGAIGAVAFGYVDDRVGSKWTIMSALIALIVLGVPIVLIDDVTTFIVMGLVIGLFMGPAQAASRTLMGRLTPPGGEGEAFGLYGLTGRATGFIGPALFSAATLLFDTQRAGMGVIILLFLVGLVLLAPLSTRQPAPAA